MATIKSFQAILPNTFYADQLVFPGDGQVFYFNIGQKEHPLRPLKEQLETIARTRPETEVNQSAAYLQIKKNLDNLIKMDRVRLDAKPCIYVYEVVHENYRQTGIWVLTSVDDYLNGNIRIHEKTLGDSERRILNYRANTGLEGSPVLLTYKPSVTINRIIAEVREHHEKQTLGRKKCQHRIWKIDNEDTIALLETAFSDIGNVYMADGHHRMAAAASTTKNLKVGNDNPFQFISSLYIASDQLRMQEYYRVVSPDFEIDEPLFWSELSKVFKISESVVPVKPEKAQVIGMAFNGIWFRLEVLDSGQPDVVLLQDLVLEPVFGITDPRTDSRLKCIGGDSAMEDILEHLKANPAAVAFTLHPLSVQHLTDIADAGEVLPPKSTWIDPKIPFGLLLYSHLLQIII